ncbi:uncharacterized protein LOC116187892 isoform X1 [Punica granatum]|uniref:Uncharacterized protein n=2 Tax=Punica granatum TaxID=22663 RepID=A0A218XYT5_PUNGR|nr:uncharacterized protein LOC116187892 isoform X1 [Punica granatum]OWM90173.1 hypothetical protein CDL15_Pgr006494 [Punica granatum]PKI52718.1 hypothetical protein CRG98_026887 [Punica granatum]
MRGIGGPLLCIGDLLSDVGEDNVPPANESISPPSLSPSSSFACDSKTTGLQPLDLPKLFAENYDQLNEALARGDHSWTALTLKLCSSLEMANALVQSTNSNTRLLLQKVGELEKIIRRGDSAVAAAKAIHRMSAEDSPSGRQS